MMENFITHDLGAVTELTVHVDATDPAVRRFRRPAFVHLTDGPELEARAAKGDTVSLLFPERRERARARRYLQDADLVVARLRLAEHPSRADRFSGTLTVIQPPRVIDLPPKLVVEISARAWSDWRGEPLVTMRPEDREELLLKLPQVDDGLAIVQIPLLMAPRTTPPGEGEPDNESPALSQDRRSSSTIAFLTADHHLLHGRVVFDGARGKVVIDAAEKLTIRANDNLPIEHIRWGGIIVRLESGLELVPEGDESAWLPAVAVAPLQPRPNPLIAAWIDYHQAERELEAERLKQREKPLRYAEARQTGRGWEFEIRVTAETLAPWLDPERPNHPEHRPRQAVRIMADADSDKPLDGELRLLSHVEAAVGVARAEVRLRDDHSAPPDHGLLLAIADEGQTTQSQRRLRALLRLVGGRTPNPRLARWLLDPARVTPPRPGLEQPLTQPEPNTEQLTAVRKALKTEDVLLIQGPPGTGKTQVLVELLAQLRRRSEGRQEPLRVLVSAVQNEALRHAASKLRKNATAEGRPPMVVHVVTPPTERAAEAARDRDTCLDIIRGLRERTDADPRVADYVELDRLEARLQELEQDLVAGDTDASELEPALTDPVLVALPGTLRAGAAEVVAPGARWAEEEVGLPDAVTPSGSDTQSGLSRLRDMLTEAPTEAGLRALGDVCSSTAGSLPEEVTLALNLVLRRAERWLRDAESARAVAHLRGAWQEALDAVSRWLPHPSASESPLAPETEPKTEPRTEALAWVNAARTWVAEAMGRAALTPALVRLRLADELEKAPDAWSRIKATYATALAATCQRSDKLRDDEAFDYAVIDEAGRASPLDLLIPMTLAKRTILIGDHHQLPPTVEDAIIKRLTSPETKATDLRRETLFSDLFGGVLPSNRVKLLEQYRMHEVIGDLVSDLFYDGQLRSYWSGERATAWLPDLGFFENKPLVWIDTAKALGNVECSEHNDVELDVVSRIFDELSRLVEAGRFDDATPTVGVITFYNRQLQRLKSLREARPALRSIVECGTVDSFQGREFPVIVLSTVRHSPEGFMGFLTLPNRINVAFSRAHRQLIVLGSERSARRHEVDERHGSRYLAGAAARARASQNGVFIDALELAGWL
jgi:hypothetical protein